MQRVTWSQRFIHLPKLNILETTITNIYHITQWKPGNPNICRHPANHNQLCPPKQKQERQISTKNTQSLLVSKQIYYIIPHTDASFSRSIFWVMATCAMQGTEDLFWGKTIHRGRSFLIQHYYCNGAIF